MKEYLMTYADEPDRFLKRTAKEMGNYHHVAVDKPVRLPVRLISGSEEPGYTAGAVRLPIPTDRYGLDDEIIAGVEHLYPEAKGFSERLKKRDPVVQGVYWYRPAADESMQNGGHCVLTFDLAKEVMSDVLVHHQLNNGFSGIDYLIDKSMEEGIIKFFEHIYHQKGMVPLPVNRREWQWGLG
jgi:hypothetical protein